MPDDPPFDVNRFPRDGWLYREKFGDKWWTVKDPLRPFLDVAKEICTARRNNGVKSKFSECVTALKRFTLVRLGKDPDQPAVIEQQVLVAEGCPGCGRKTR